MKKIKVLLTLTLIAILSGCTANAATIDRAYRFCFGDGGVHWNPEQLDDDFTVATMGNLYGFHIDSALNRVGNVAAPLAGFHWEGSARFGGPVNYVEIGSDGTLSFEGSAGMDSGEEIVTNASAIKTGETAGNWFGLAGYDVGTTSYTNLLRFYAHATSPYIRVGGDTNYLHVSEGGAISLNGTAHIGGVNATEFGYLDGVTRDVQEQLDEKAAEISSGTSALGTSEISSGGCASAVTTSATGVATTDVINWGFNGDPTGVTGYNPSTGVLTIFAYPSADNVNFKVCNLTASAITPGAVTLNWRVDK